ncbi:MAG: hypothetical protein Q9M97_01395 [Candidatus Gracilibacteria bacterium]|nr:hypothetical protein [Candidatus Gracilibacteria bacterium]
MVAMGNYSEKNNKIGSFYHVAGTFLFVVLGLYGLIFQDFYQYILFQISFIITGIKAFTYYNYKKDIKIFNEKSMVIYYYLYCL